MYGFRLYVGSRPWRGSLGFATLNGYGWLVMNMELSKWKFDLGKEPRAQFADEKIALSRAKTVCYVEMQLCQEQQ